MIQATHQTITILPIASDVSLRAVIADQRDHPPEQAARIDALWTQLRKDNDRLFDGPMLRSLSVDAATGELLCRRDSYRSLAASARLGLGIRQLGVMGVLTGFDSDRQEHVLLARRSAQTRIYPGLWELAPSGGVAPPTPNISQLFASDLAAALADEAEEELGLSIENLPAIAVAILRDDIAHSDDIVLRIALPETIDPRRAVCALESEAADRWEYLDMAWVAISDVRGFAHEHAAAIAPPTHALLRWFNWA